MTYTKKIATAIATGAVLLSSVAPAFAATNSIQITGNGASTDNTAVVSTSNTNTVTQTNTANVNNNTTVNSNTGNNKANDNLGGDVSVQSGNATANVTNTTAANQNVANVSGCNCQSGTDVLIGGNLKDSTNTVGLTQSNTTGVTQTNVANVNNNTTVDSNTGHNSANDNGGSMTGGVSVQSGNAETNVTNHTAVNANSATIGNGGAGSDASPAVSARIIGNGKNSDNTIVLGVTNSAEVDQTNVANVNDNTTVNSETGHNSANDNLGGGDVSILSGNAKANVTNDTMANFNGASLDNCDCTNGVLAKINSNLANSDNTIGAQISNDQGTFQTSVSNLNNNTTNNGNTGHNYASNNGGASNFADPSVQSGNAGANVNNSNGGNVNTVGNGITIPFPTGSQVSFTFNGSSVMGWWAWLATQM